MLTPLQELAALLRPSGGGVYLVSTGKAQQLALQQRLYGVTTAAQVEEAFLVNLERLATAKGVLLGVPSDVGAGFSRGANLGPQAIRSRLLEVHPDWRQQQEQLGLVDLGDVFVVPQLLHDEMLSEQQREASRRAIYPRLAPGDAASLPVSPLSIAERAWDLIFKVNPAAKPFVIGGDHSTALPVTFALGRARKPGWGIVQPDAHTDLLPERLGVKYCFATWSWHANEVIGRKGRLTQVGVRASGKNRAHWESTCDVRQFWAHEILENPAGALDAVLAHVKRACPGGVYFSNDIDGTDSLWADATGTPEPDGLTPDWVLELIKRLGAEVGLLGGDIMEVAPELTRTPNSQTRTVGLATKYLYQTIQAALGTTR